MFASVWRTTWWTVVDVAAVAGALGAPSALGISRAVSLMIALAFIGAMLGVAFSGEGGGVRRPMLVGAGLGTLPCVVSGLLHILGPSGWALIGILIVTSPYVALPVRRLVVQRLLPSDTGGEGPVSSDEALRRRWLESGKRLQGASSNDDRLRIVVLRALVLDDLVDRYGAQLPEYVWTELSDGSGPDHAHRRPEAA